MPIANAGHLLEQTAKTLRQLAIVFDTDTGPHGVEVSWFLSGYRPPGLSDGESQVQVDFAQDNDTGGEVERLRAELKKLEAIADAMTRAGRLGVAAQLADDVAGMKEAARQ